ncbi:MAG: acetoacetate decarboxylase family protein [Candidimonas sp.]|jgi:hypothetical protein
MAYELHDHLRYRSPIHFGPAPGPRQGPDGKSFDLSDNPALTVATVKYLTDADKMERLLPENMKIDGDPVVTVELQVFSELAWLAGRGYSTLNVKFPVLFQGKKDRARGQLLAVIWENMADPIISGREELGYAKIFADIAPERNLDGKKLFSAGWGGHDFFTMQLSKLDDVDTSTVPGPADDGVLHVKYVPGTGKSAPPDAHYVTLTPHGGSTLRYERILAGEGELCFTESTWEQLPTLFHIVNALAHLPVLEWRGARYVQARGGKDLSDVRRLD